MGKDKMKKEKIWVGIDPGKTGGLSWINSDCSEYQCFYTPENLNGMADILIDLKTTYNVVKVTIEDIPTIKAVGKTSYGKLKQNEGQWHGIVAALGLAIYAVKPNTWQVKYFGQKKKGMKRDTKKLSREHASRMFPNESFKKVKDDGKSDSILIAKYGKDFL